MNTNALNQLLTSSAQSADLFKLIIAECNHNTIKELLVGMKPSRQFKDEIDDDKVAKYRPQVTDLMLKSELLAYLRDVETDVKKSKNDVTTFKKPEHKGIEIGMSQFKLYDMMADVDGVQAIAANGGAIGVLDPANQMAIIASTSAREQHNEKKKKKKDYKDNHFDAANNLAPTDTLSTMIGTLGVVTRAEATSIDATAVKFRDLDTEAFGNLMKIYNDNVPRVIGVKGSKIPVMKFTVKDNKYMVDTVKQPTDITGLQGEYDSIIIGISKFQVGTKIAAIKRIARNGYTGIPIEALPIDDVLSLADAGVKVKESVFVNASDSTMLSVIRSNFGNKCLGVGVGEHAISPVVAGTSFFDYAYYPKPIVVNKAKSFDISMKEAINKLIKHLDTEVIGKRIMHLSPYLFYCKEFCEAMGYEIDDKVDPTLETPTKKVALVTMKRQSIHFKADRSEDFKVWVPPRVPDDWIARIYPKKVERKAKSGKVVEENPKYVGSLYGKKEWHKMTFFEQLNHNDTGQVKPLQSKSVGGIDYLERAKLLKHKLELITTYTKLTYQQVNTIRIPMMPSIYSYRGTMMYVEGGEKHPLSDIIGMMFFYMKETFRNIWKVIPLSQSTYRLNFIRKGAIVDNLMFNDIYSAMYDSVILDEFKLQDSRKIEQLKEGVEDNSDEYEDNDDDDEYENDDDKGKEKEPKQGKAKVPIQHPQDVFD